MRAKYVNESISKYNFERKGNKLSSLGIGQITLIEKWLKEMGIDNYDYIINNDLTIDINDDVDLRNKNLVEFPSYIQFKIINGHFSCTHNQLISLRGCPKIVNGYFDCEYNHLKTLEYSPKIVGGSFLCQFNKLINLKGASENVGRNFNCRFNDLVSLEGAPKIVDGNFECDDNPKKFTVNDVQNVCKVSGTIIV